jgi:nucleoid DNA-binding protein
MTLTKRDLVVRISEDTGMIQNQVLDVVQRTLDYIAESLARGDKVELRNFGVFEVKVRKARIGRNPNSPAMDVPIPERSVVKFKAGKEMRAAVLKLPSKAVTGTDGAPTAKPSAAPATPNNPTTSNPQSAQGSHPPRPSAAA